MFRPLLFAVWVFAVGIAPAGDSAAQRFAAEFAAWARQDVTDPVITGGFGCHGKGHGGLEDPDPARLGGFAVPRVTQDYFYGDDGDLPAGFVLTGLDPALSYRFRFFASRGDPETRITRYTLVGAPGHAPVSVELQTSGVGMGAGGKRNGNDDTVATVAGVRPDAFGKVFVDVARARGSCGYLGAMAVTAAPVSAPAGGG